MMNGAAVSFSSSASKRDVVALSSKEKYYVILQAVVKETVWICLFVNSPLILNGLEDATKIHTWNQGAIVLSNNGSVNRRTQNIDENTTSRYRLLREESFV